MDVLCIIPPYIPSYFNAGHHMGIYQVSAYLKRLSFIKRIDSIDASVFNYTWRDICRLLINRYDVICIMNDLDGIDGLERFIYYSRKLSPSSKILTFGRLSKLAPKMFERLDVDAIHVEGDYESGVASYCSFIVGFGNCAGVMVKENGTFKESAKGVYLPPEEWGMPDVNDMPLEHYSAMYTNDANKFCGIPGQREIVVQVARGCPFGCAYCDVTHMQGQKERRLPLKILQQYLKEAYDVHHYDYVSFYAPTFTLNREWTVEFCKANTASANMYKWKCATTTCCLDAELIKLMGESGCVRISVGVESMLTDSQNNLPEAKRINEDYLRNLAALCHSSGIELNCFIMLGFPEDQIEDIKRMILFMKSLDGVRVRPTVYTPYYDMENTDDLSVVPNYNRQLLVGDHDAGLEQGIYEILYKDEYYKKLEISSKFGGSHERRKC